MSQAQDHERVKGFCVRHQQNPDERTHASDMEPPTAHELASLAKNSEIRQPGHRAHGVGGESVFLMEPSMYLKVSLPCPIFTAEPFQEIHQLGSKEANDRNVETPSPSSLPLYQLHLA